MTNISGAPASETDTPTTNNELQRPLVLAPRSINGSRGQGNQGRVEVPKPYDWASFVKLAASPTQAAIPHTEFMALPKNSRGALKQIDPFILFGACEDGRRTDEHLLYRSAVALDFDAADAAGLLNALRPEFINVQFAYVWHTTRSHCLDAVRLRVLVPLARDVRPEEYRPLAEVIAREFRATLDPASLKPAQMMYLPMRNQGAPFESGAFEGRGYLNPDAYLADVAIEVAQGKNSRAIAKRANDFNPLETAEPPIGVTLDQAREYLAKLSADIPEPEWLAILHSIHHEFGNGPHADEAREMAREWSATAGDRFDDDAFESRYDRAQTSPRSKPRTFRSIIKAAADAERQKTHARVTHWCAKIAAADDRVQLRDDIPRAIRRDMLLDADGREELAQVLRKRLGAVLGTSPRIDSVRRWLEPDIERRHGAAPEWASEHVYVTEDDVFYSLKSKMKLSRTSFNAHYNRNMPHDNNGRVILSAADAALDSYQIEVVSRIGYYPQGAARYAIDGIEYVNSYDPSQLPAMPRVLLDEEAAAVAHVRAHIANLFPDQREHELFESWLAYVVQNPGVKVRWAPYIQGPQGDGKSFFADLLAHAMGARNVQVRNGSLFENGNFSNWSVGQCINVIEEIKLQGHNKFDAVNRLKPYITNDTISVHPKNKAPYTAPNTTQYLLLSNYMDGVPVDDDDRRFCFFKSRFSMSSLAAFKTEHPTYYERLFHAARTYPGAMRYWLMHFKDFHPDFKPDGNAPITAMRAMAIEMSRSDVDFACQEVLAEKPGGVTAQWVASTMFVTAVEKKLPTENRMGRQKLGAIVSQFLSNQGYISMGNQQHRVGPGRDLSRFWRHESVAALPDDWWCTAGPVIKASFKSAAANDFLV